MPTGEFWGWKRNPLTQPSHSHPAIRAGLSSARLAARWQTDKASASGMREPGKLEAAPGSGTPDWDALRFRSSGECGCLLGLQIPGCTAARPTPAPRPAPREAAWKRRGAGTMRLTRLLAMGEKLTPPWAAELGWAGRKAPRRKKPALPPIPEEDWQVFRGDTVQILSGREAGKQGQVIQVDKEQQSVLLDRLNMGYYYADTLAGRTMFAREKPLSLKEVGLVDPTDRLPTEVAWRYTEQGERVRVSVRTGRIIPKPIEQREDGIVPELWVDGPKDTSTKDTLEKTYTPSLKTFQEEIMERMGIVETRRHRKSYWY
ncbi:large ribosomal subunit protein uL24m [Ahaetulla prasina]|uniref:large ribosomal subunit protein uL24m n=1 Tax=Ahaetulla prasina TaxID=499056 RepID=UPI00264769A8|nr:large ribosomal subunit protein uL24m [Ahaetulla prasina]